MPQNIVVGWLSENWIAFGVVGAGCVAYYKIEKALEWKKVLFKDDGSLNYLLRKEYDKDMQLRNQDREKEIDKVISQDTLKLTIKEHEQLCRIASLEMAKNFAGVLDNRFEAFETKLFKALKLNGFGEK